MGFRYGLRNQRSSGPFLSPMLTKTHSKRSVENRIDNRSSLSAKSVPLGGSIIQFLEAKLEVGNFHTERVTILSVEECDPPKSSTVVRSS